MRSLTLVVLLGLGACDVQDQAMRTQKKYVTEAPSTLWRNGTSARRPPAGAHPIAADIATSVPPPVTPLLLERGRVQYEIFCTPCHGFDGRGDGTVVQRGFPKPPSYFEDRLRAASAAHFYDVISNGYGVMFPYGARVAPADRWAIIAYIRALQLSDTARVADVLGLDEVQP